MRPLTLTALLFLVAGPANGVEVETRELRAELIYGYGTSVGTPVQAGIALEPKLELAFGEWSRFVGSARVRWDGEDRLEPGRPDTGTYSDASEPWVIGTSTVAELRDVYLEVGWSRGQVRIGKQQIAWGALDGLKILDTLNPQSFREFILDDFGDSRIGLWSAYVDASLGHWRAELAWIPDITGHDIPGTGAWFELLAPRFRYGAAPDAPGLPTITTRPGSGLGESSVGLRLSRLLGGWDLGVVAVSGYDFEPLGRVIASSSGPVLERYYERRALLGLSAATSIGSVAFRSELAFRPDRHFNLREGGLLTATQLDQYTAGVGIDIEGPFDSFINIQLVLDHVQSAPPGLTRPATDRLVTVFLRRTFAYETIVAELRWYGDTGQGDGLVRGGLSYAVNDEITVKLGFDTFHGDADGLFGQFADRDRITLSLEHFF